MMIQSEIIIANDEKKFIDDLNFFLEKLASHQFLDIKFSSQLMAGKICFEALIIYKVE